MGLILQIVVLKKAHYIEHFKKITQFILYSNQIIQNIS